MTRSPELPGFGYIGKMRQCAPLSRVSRTSFTSSGSSAPYWHPRITAQNGLFFIPFAILIFVVEEIRKAIKQRLDRKTEKVK